MRKLKPKLTHSFRRKFLAEREGFEPSLGLNPTTALAKPPLQPLEYLSAYGGLLRHFARNSQPLPVLKYFFPFYGLGKGFKPF